MRALLYVFMASVGVIAFSVCNINASEKKVRLDDAESVANSFFLNNGKYLIGSEEFNRSFSSTVGQVHSRAEYVEWILKRSDAVDVMVRISYLRDLIVVRLLLYHPQGMYIAEVRGRISGSTSRFEVKSSAVRLLKGVYIPTEDQVPVEELEIRE